MKAVLSRNAPRFSCFSANTLKTRTVVKCCVRRIQVSSMQGCSRQNMPYKHKTFAYSTFEAFSIHERIFE
jgi:hypothetical protein